MNTLDKLKIIAYAIHLQILEVIDGVKLWCYAEKVKLTEETIKKHNELCVKCIPEDRIC